MPKPNIGKLIKAIKQGVKQDKGPKPKVAPKDKPTINTFRVRDMRQESMDLGSHGARDYFGGQK